MGISRRGFLGWVLAAPLAAKVLPILAKAEPPELPIEKSYHGTDSLLSETQLYPQCYFYVFPNAEGVWPTMRWDHLNRVQELDIAT